MNIYDEMPQMVETAKTIGGYVTYIYLERRKLTEEEVEATGSDPTKEWWTAHLALYNHEQPLSEVDYGPIVTAIVRSKYTSSEMESITNNYLQETDLAKLIALLSTTQNFNKLHTAMSAWLSDRDGDIVSEYEKMQEWRRKAKEAARIAIGTI